MIVHRAAIASGELHLRGATIGGLAEVTIAGPGGTIVPLARDEDVPATPRLSPREIAHEVKSVGVELYRGRLVERGMDLVVAGGRLSDATLTGYSARHGTRAAWSCCPKPTPRCRSREYAGIASSGSPRRQGGHDMALDEIAASLYAWDLADEGIDRCLDNLQERALVNSAYLVALMHREKRPLHARFYPHNPKRKYYCPEDSRAYWKPDLSCYAKTPIKPVTSERDFLKGVDWLDVLIKAARKRGMKTGAEVSHTILDAEIARAKFSDVLQRDVWGEAMGIPKRRVLPCPNAPAIRGYLVGLFSDLVKNHDVDFVQTCLLLFAQGRSEWGGGAEWQRLLDLSPGGCFCPACEAAARAAGHDWEAMVADTRRLANVVRRVSLEDQHEAELLDESNVTATSLILENPGFAEWLRFRIESVTGLFKLIHDEIHAINPKIDFRYNTHTAYPELSGIDFKSAYLWVDSVRESDYSDQLGTIEGLEIKRRKLHKIRRVLGDKPMLCALGVRPRATPEVLRAAVRIAADCGSDGLSLGHYDGATMERLEAVAQGVREAEGQEIDWIPPSRR